MVFRSNDSLTYGTEIQNYLSTIRKDITFEAKK